MNHLVPDFQLDGDYPISSFSTPPRPNKSPMAEEEIIELLWQNGQVVMQGQNQRSIKKSEQLPAAREIRPAEEEPSPLAQQLFMQEDEMASWLHYPMDDSSFDRELYSDLFYPPAPCTSVSVAPPPPPTTSLPPQVPLARRGGGGTSPRVHNFTHFSRAKPSRGLTVVDSNVTPQPPAAVEVSGGNLERGAEQVETSSPGGSGASISASAEPSRCLAATTDGRKRKGVETDDTECHSEDLEFESLHAKKQIRGSTSSKRSRAAEVHNLSERRRRDRINEKMRALQELIPRCNKSDKASMLDEAIEYLKSLQMQVQMMSMGCGMVPMMFPGMQQYMPPMGMGMGMEMGMNRPMMPFLPMMPGSAVPNPAAAAHLGPRFPMPAFHIQSVPLPNSTCTQAMNQSDPIINSRTQTVNHPRMPFFLDPYQQYLGLQQVPMPQNHVITQPSTSKPSSSREAGNHLDPKPGL